MKSGEILINIRATAIVYTILVKMLTKINESLEQILAKKEVGSLEVKTFIANYMKLDLAEYILYSSFTADQSHLFY